MVTVVVLCPPLLTAVTVLMVLATVLLVWRSSPAPHTLPKAAGTTGLGRDWGDSPASPLLVSDRIVSWKGLQFLARAAGWMGQGAADVEELVVVLPEHWVGLVPPEWAEAACVAATREMEPDADADTL
jgi:hypothetical protein